MDSHAEGALSAGQGARIRVLHLITSLDIGGAEVMLEKLVTSMHRDRFETLVVSLTDFGPVGHRLVAAGVVVESLAIKGRGFDPLAVFRLLKIMAAYRPHVLQTWLYHADLLGTIAARLRRAPHLIWNVRCTEVDFSQYSPLTRWVVKALAWLSPQADAIMANSTAGREWHTKLGYHPKEWIIIPNGFDLGHFKPDPQARAAFRQSLGIDDGTFLVGLPARLDPIKDHETFLRAARELLNSGHKARYVLVGRGTEASNPAIGALLARLGLEGVVHALGERSDIAKIFPGLDAVVLSSVSEGFPNVLGEAMACGVPCIATRVGDAAAILGNAGALVPPRDPSAIAAALADFAVMPSAERHRLGLQARAHIEANFSLGAITARYEAMYERVVGSAALRNGVD
jgi:glycosyltransferase involved in cell wall biosynthesis